MTKDATTNPLLQNQSLIRFDSAGLEQIAYSNTVITPVIGPVLSLTKSALTAEASLGQMVSYRISILNSGNRAAQTTIYDELPEGASFITNSVLLDGVPMPGVRPETGIPLGGLPAQGSASVVFQVIVVSIPSGLQLINQAEARYSFRADDGRFIQGAAASNLVEIPVKAYLLSAYLSASTEYTFVGDQVTYVIRLVNEGSETIRKLLITVPLPPQVQWTPGSVVIDAVYAPVLDPTAGIPVASMALGSSLQIVFQIQVLAVPPESRFFSQADIQYTVGEQRLNFQTNTVKIDVINPLLSIVNTVDYNLATAGDILTYAVTVSNNGNYTVEATLDITIPKGTLYVWDSIHINGEALIGAAPVQSIGLGLLRAGMQAVVTFKVSIPRLASPSPPLISNTASVNYTFRLPDGRAVRRTEISDSVETELVLPIIVPAATIHPSAVGEGDEAQCRVNTENKGNWPALVYLTSLIPKGSVYIEESFRKRGTAEEAEASAGSLSFSLGAIAPEDSVYACYMIRVFESSRHYIAAHFRYELNGREYRGEARSNIISVTVESPDE